MTLEEQIQSEIENEKKLSAKDSSEKPVEEKPPLADVTAPQPVSGMTQVKSKPLEYMEPATEWRGMTGAINRGLTVPGVQSAAGALLGTLAGPPGIAAGAAAGPIVFGLGDLAIEGVNSYFGTDFATSRGAITHLLDALGAPKPDTAAERVTEAVTEGLSSAGGSAAGFQKAGETAKAGAKFFKFMGEKPVEQAVIGGLAGGASSGAQEAGTGPVGSALAGLAAAGSVPALKYGTRAGMRTFFPTKQQLEQEAMQSAQGVYQTLLPDEKSRQEAISSLKRAGEVADKDIKLMTGEITGQTGLLALQQALEKSSIEVANRKVENIRGISTKVSEGLETTGVKPEEAEMFFKSKLDELENVANQSSDALTLSGDIESQAMINESKQILAEQKKLAETGVLTAEEAYKNAENKLNNRIETYKLSAGAEAKDPASKIASNVIEKQNEAGGIYATQLYSKIGKVDPFEQPNTKKAIDNLIAKTPEGENGTKDIPKIIKDIYANISDQDGNLKLKELWEPVDWRQKLNDEINKAIRTGNKKESKKLIEIKKSIDADLALLEEVYPQIKEANKFYSEYSDIFNTGASEEAFKEGVSATKVLKEYIPASAELATEDDLLRLRKAIEGHPKVPTSPELVKEGFDAVDDWVYSQAFNSINKENPSSSLKTWVSKNGSRIFKAFEGSKSNVKQGINDLISEFEGLEQAKKTAEESLELSKIKRIEQGESAELVNNQNIEAAKLLKSQMEKTAQKILTDFQEQNIPSRNPANQFIGGNAEDIFGKIFASDTSRADMAKVIEAASKDPTGKALEGLKNAARKNLKSKIGDFSKPTVKAGMTDAVRFTDELKVSLGESQRLLEPGSPKRDVLEMLFGKDSRELNSLDKTREFLNMMSQKTDFSASDVAKYKDIAQNSNINDLLSLGAIAFGNVKGFVAWKSLDLIRKFQKSTRKDVSEIFKDILVKAQFDPETAIILSQPITPENFKLTQRLLRNFGIQAEATDFGIEEPTEEGQETTQNKSGEFPKL
jgi:hypothetical protein